MAKLPNSQMNKALAYLIAAFPDCPEFTELNYQVYYDVLAEHSFDDILAGVRRFVKESGSKFFPSAPQLVRWVDPKTTVDAIFDAAMQEQTEYVTKRDRLLEAFLAKKAEACEWFVMTRMHSDSPYRDTWEWVDEGKTLDLYKHHRKHNPNELRQIHLGIDQAIKMALVNSLRAWMHDQGKLDRGGQ